MSQVILARGGRAAPLSTPTDLESDATRDISAALNGLLEVWIDQTEQRSWLLFEATRTH